jgi:DMSO/TMAO reductase YedYZ molybdopterin-dependent catalytic subunit
MKRSLIVITIILSLVSSAFSQTEAFITVDGEVKTPLKLSMADVRKLAPAEVKTKDRDGNEHIYSGTLLATVLASAGVTLGKDLRGENLVKYVVVKAIDGYEVLYSLAEVDPELSSSIVLLAIQVDGNPLPKGNGPFRLVAPNDKRPARWIREINSIKVVFSKN